MCLLARPLRVAYDTTPVWLNRAGEFRYATRLAGALAAKRAVEVHPVLEVGRRPGALAQRVALQCAIQAAGYPLVLRRQVRRAQADLVHFTRHLVPPTPGVRVPCIVTVHDVLPLREPQLYSAAIRTNYRLLTPRAVRRAVRVITGSQYTRGELTELLDVDPARIDVTPYGVDSRFRPAPADPRVLRARFGIDRPFVACVGTLEPRKNLAGAVEAFARLTKHDRGTSLVVIGGRGWDAGATERAARRARAPIVLTGHVSDEELVGLLGSARCFLFPSFYEGFGLPPLEAMACGTPVVAADRASLPEVTGGAALLVDPEDPEAMASTVHQVLEDEALAERLRELGLRQAARYSWDACAASTLVSYRHALETRG